MSDSASAEDEVIRLAALKAARDAAEHMVKNSAQKNTNAVGAFALYTWGSLAFVSAMFVAVVGLSPSGLVPQPNPMAESDQTKKVQLARTEPVEPQKQEEVAVKLEKPDLPEVELPKVKMVKTKQDLKLDTFSTGAVEEAREEQLQASPEALPPEMLFAVDIGGADSATPLIQRYIALRRRAPDLFGQLEGRIQMQGRGSAPAVRLVAGPFATQNEVAYFCRAIRLRLTLDCAISTFEGQAIN